MKYRVIVNMVVSANGFELNEEKIEQLLETYLTDSYFNLDATIIDVKEKE